MEDLVHLDQLTKNYGSFCALNEISLRIRPGVTGLLGPNGAGKSTLIKVMLGLVKVTSGSGQILGLRMGADALKIRAEIGYMPEDDCYIPGMSGVDSVRFSAQLSGIPSVEALRRAHEILDFCGAGQERYRMVHTYSTGMRQKAKFAQAIVHDPPFLIFDEPTSGLDPEERDAMLRRIRLLADRSGKSVLICTHILPDVQAICDDVIIISDGQVRLQQPLAEINRPSSAAYFLKIIGDPQRFVDHINQDGGFAKLTSNSSILIDATDDEIIHQIWSWAFDARVSIKSLTPDRNSLEQVFLDAVGESNFANP